MKFYKCIGILFLCCFLGSCSAAFHKDNIQEFETGFQISVLNNSYEIKNDTILNTGKYKLLDLFNLYDKKVDTVNLQFTTNGELILSFIEDIQGLKRKQTIIYEGKFKSKEKYKITLVKERVQVPPLVPIIYGTNHIEKIKIKLMENGDLIVKEYFRKEGNIFLITAGPSHKSKSFYKKLH
ncbi:hypothetical protein GCM10011344_29300 [Dokdonia pacifica]|uniref:Lipoprotein n=1 Tax=Dokdonia pacifica TaxID=1627892 RepID=A0A239C408_9FLAO|nr:hypothetical protein [Dokdonia pacifica]GGG26677.1 hypothetical protein GCM10011344_29300 [Dokdonia pacifica]SNS14870.1 hypothetical protein SAMN06265376_107113 [Dokdonia pacifica]